MSRHSPYGSSLARSALDAALAFAAFEQPVQLAFIGDGVLQLLPGQDGKLLGGRNLERVLASLPLYDIEVCYVDASALARHAIDPASLPEMARLLDETDLRQLLLASDHLLGF